MTTVSSTSPLPVALVVPRNGARRWQIGAVKHAEQAGAIWLDAVLEARGSRGTVRDTAVDLLASVEALINRARRSNRTSGQARSLLARRRAHEEWPEVGISMPSRSVWPLVINLSDDDSRSLAELATLGVVECRLGNSRDLDDALNSLRLRHSTIDLSASLVRADGSVEIARTVAAVRERRMIVSSLEILSARAMTMLARAITSASRCHERLPAPAASRAAPTSALSWSQAARLVLGAVGDYAQTALERLHSTPTWFLAYRESPEHFVANTLKCSAEGLKVITPPPHRFYADPCVFAHENTDHVFFEDYDYRTGKGVISWMQRLSPGTFSSPEVVLDCPYHLSYPFVFAHEGTVFMIPETCRAGRIELYRALDVPRRWELASVLIDGIRAVDATLLQHDGRWWMFACVGEARSSTSDELFVYHADSLLGPWRPHAANPVKSDVRSARPAGRFFQHDGRLIRPAQNCSRVYGGSLALCEVLELTTSTYRERVIGDLDPGWAAGNSGFHTVSASERLEVIDGNMFRPVAGNAQ